MTTQLVPQSLHKDFESIKKIDENKVEYWEARELMPLLGYLRWDKFYEAIKRAMITCVSTSQSARDHFRGAAKMVDIGSKTRRNLVDYRLSRFACYLIAQNGDPRKPEIAFAQTYFAVQTRKQELFESLDEDGKRLFTRQQVSIHNKQLFDTAKTVGVGNFGRFNNAGYLGLYGLAVNEIKQKKQIGDDEILDRAGSTELAANLFRITQTDAKLRKDRVIGENAAVGTHFKVGKEVRHTIEKIGGTMPEELAAEEHIGEVVQRKLKQLPGKDPKKKKGIAGA
ncbi:DNA damage-inducible protein D [Patescibacteria group bacterium]|jgi:DNA-damage-inducible protein D|nr:DNA damage-inducible protein D [Patescibacteria group bacterium]MBP9763104.1 DNA damage-inducible protein D [Patescibacteria group bacterium]